VIKNQNVLLSSTYDERNNRIALMSPADIFYYTGHGFHDGFPSDAGALAFEPRVFPEDLRREWLDRSVKVRALIIAGCSVVGINKFKGTVFVGNHDAVGMRWSQLLTTKGGPAEHICGY
jgi:hypothetical protein